MYEIAGLLGGILGGMALAVILVLGLQAITHPANPSQAPTPTTTRSCLK